MPKPDAGVKPGAGVPQATDTARESLAAALEVSKDAEAKVEACADELASANDHVKGRIADGATTLAADKALADGESVEAQILEVAVDLRQVSESLAQGVEDHQRMEQAYTQSQEALARSTAALAAAQEQERAATWRSLHDPLTELPNRTLFDDRLAQGIAIAQRHGLTLAVMFFDLDRFKSINDEHGHAAGDAALKEVAHRLSEHARDVDTVCRNGGDEFLYLLMHPQGRDNLLRIAGQLAHSVALPIDLGPGQLSVTMSIGIAIYPEHAISGELLIRQADAAMYRAKASDSRCEVFEEDPSDG